MALTAKQIEALKPESKPYTKADGRGLSIEIAPTGGRWWRFKYRHGGKQKRLSLGTYPDIDLKTARERREEMRQMVARGIDPLAQRKAEMTMMVSTTMKISPVTRATPDCRAFMFREGVIMSLTWPGF